MPDDNHTLTIRYEDGDLVVDRGDQCPEDLGFLDLLTTRRRYITFRTEDTDMAFVYPRAKLTFFEELEDRGYDLDTFQMSLSTEADGKHSTPPMDIEPGELSLWFGAGDDPDEGEDFRGNHGGEGACKADCNLLFCDLISNDDYVWDDEGGKIIRKPGFILQAEDAGFDVRSIVMSVRQKTPTALPTP